MASSTLQLKDLAASSRIDHDPTTYADSYEQIAVLFATDLRFETYEFRALDDGAVSLSNATDTLFFISETLWRNIANLKSYIAKAESSHASIICCGTELEFANFSDDLMLPFIHQLVTPVALRTIDFQVKALFRSKRYHNQATQDKKEADETLQNIKNVLSISRELNGVRDVNRLLSLILAKARSVTHADAGSIYVVEYPNNNTKDGYIVFKVCQNESINLNLTEFRMPINDRSIVGNSVLLAKTINIPDLYQLSPNAEQNPYHATHDTSWDQRNGYETHSMLSIPVFDISHAVIGVIQLINCKISGEPLTNKDDFEKRVIPFDDTAIEYGEIVAHQAGIALENALLTEEKEALFRGFVDASVKAIEQRDPTTSGHSHRVARLTLKLAELIHHVGSGPFKSIQFNEHQMKEIEYASLLHDFGKLGVREQVLLKAKKLYGWQLDLLLERFELIKARYEIDYLNDLVNFLQAPNTFPPGLGISSFTDKKNAKVNELESFLNFILKANEPTVLEQGGFERLKDIANLCFDDSRCKQRPFLKPEELKALSVSRGSLTTEEFAEIQSHVTHTYEFLRKIPWGKNLANVPQIAAKHHEKLDGTGYPTAATAQEIPIQSRMMTISDIFDALTASDRPYKKAVPTEKALSIIEMEVKAGKCDPELFKIFVESKCYNIVF